MDTSFSYYIVCLVAAIIGFLILKKVTSCMIKVVVGLVLLAFIAIVYFKFIA